jgi:antitoxin VapB
MKLNIKVLSKKGEARMFTMFICTHDSRRKVMALQIANAVVIEKINELAKITGLTKTAAVEKAVDELLRISGSKTEINQHKKMFALLAQFDRLDHNGSNAPTDITWDENGLPT